MSSRMGEDQALALALEGRIRARGETSKLVELAGTLASLPDPEIDPRFAAMLEQRLLTEGLDVQAGPVLTVVRSIPETPADEVVRTADVIQMPRRRMVLRRGLVAGAVAASMAAFPLVAAASALPGSPFYGIKHAIERIELAFAGNDVARGLDYAKFAQTRMSEASQMVSLGGDADLIAATVAEARSDMTKASNFILGHTTNVDVLSRFASIAAETARDIRGINGPMSSQTRAQFAGALRATQQIQAEVAQALGVPMSDNGIAPRGVVQPIAVDPSQANAGQTQQTSGGSTGATSQGDTKGSSGSSSVKTPSGDGQAETDAKNVGCAVPGSANGVGDLTAPVVRVFCD